MAKRQMAMALSLSLSLSKVSAKTKYRSSLIQLFATIILAIFHFLSCNDNLCPQRQITHSIQCICGYKWHEKKNNEK